ncbi:MAG: DUF11 domain-containing protein, partial [Lutibacter sp.]|uniref:Ig-like domain-containing protein n=1 Tax=Lutibacter sp. TaxID=1925666 RepID=UPI00179FCECC
MKKNYFLKSHTFKKLVRLGLLAFVLIIFSFNSYSQVRVPFTPRASEFTPENTTYHVKGDFSMLGNTNLTLVDYDKDEDNGYNDMRYVDIDTDNNTWNSSSSILEFSTENNANPECSNILFAGLYWTGRAGSSDTFQVTKEFPTGEFEDVEVTDSERIYDNKDIPNTNYELKISRSGDSNNRIITYTFQSSEDGDDKIAFIHYNNNGTQLLKISINDGPIQDFMDESDGDDVHRDYTNLNPAYVIFSDANYTLKLTRLERDGANSDDDAPTSAFVDITYLKSVPKTIEVVKDFDKRKVSLKGPNSSSYSTITANTNDIYYPTTEDGSMFSAFSEITEYVRENGIGEYFVADIALLEGDGGGTGYYGGWGMVVVYENSKMKWRDVTVFDGHAYVQGSTTISHTLDVEGFQAVQTGDVNFKLGLIAGEGDRNITGDYFQIQKQSDGQYVNLKHSENEFTNFFNSSIETDTNVRDPELNNNTGIDIVKFEIDNNNNEVISNNQTSTRFRYGSTQDTYVIFNITYSVDSYIPEPEGVITVSEINHVVYPTVLNVLPGEEIEYTLTLKNKGTEAINDLFISIPVPYTSTYIPSSIEFTVNAPLSTTNVPYFDPSAGATGSVIWDVGTLPMPFDPADVLATLTYKLRATTDCGLLVNTMCDSQVALNGTISGTGVTTSTSFTQLLYQGYETSGPCEGEPIPTPIIVYIDGQDYVDANCSNYVPIRDFTFCNYESNQIQISEVQAEFPTGSRYYNEYPVTSSSIEYTALNPFPAVTATYFAVPPGSTLCFYEFTNHVLQQDDLPTTSNINYCKNSTASPLTAIGNGLLWYTNAAGGTGSSTAPTPSTSDVGDTTYYVTQTSEDTCESERVALVVTVHEPPYAGSDGTLTLCEGAIPTELELYNALGDTPDAGGVWTNSGLVYTYTLAATDYCSSDTSTVTVNFINVTANAGADATINCTNTTAQLTATGGVSYSWSPATGLSATN